MFRHVQNKFEFKRKSLVGILFVQYKLFSEFHKIVAGGRWRTTRQLLFRPNIESSRDKCMAMVSSDSVKYIKCMNEKACLLGYFVLNNLMTFSFMQFSFGERLTVPFNKQTLK